MIPIPPTSSEMPPIAPSSRVNVPVMLFSAESVSFWFVTVKSAFSGFEIRCRFRRTLCTSAVTLSMSSDELALMTMLLTTFVRPVSTCCAVVAGTRIWSSRLKPKVEPFGSSTPMTLKLMIRARCPKTCRSWSVWPTASPSPKSCCDVVAPMTATCAFTRRSESVKKSPLCVLQSRTAG